MAEPDSETVWRFEDHLALHMIEEKLRIAEINYSRHSTTVSYFLKRNGHPWLESYELHAAYTGNLLPKGEPEVEKSYVRNSYGVLNAAEGNRWITDSEGQQISEEEFYSMVLYARPDRVLSLQQTGFETSSGQYLVELNMESKLLVLIGLGATDSVPPMLADMVLPERLSRSSYLLELFSHNGGPLSS